MDTNLIIDRIGGTSIVAGICEVTPSAVSQWRVNGIPRPWMMFLREAFPAAFLGEAESLDELPDDITK